MVMSVLLLFKGPRQIAAAIASPCVISKFKRYLGQNLGICYGQECLCLPSYQPPLCRYSIRGFHSLASWLYDMYLNSCQLVGVTTDVLELPVPGAVFRVFNTLGILELLMVLNITVYLLWTWLPPRHMSVMYKHFTLSYHEAIRMQRLHTLITAPMSHRGIIPLIVTLNSLYYGRQIIQQLGDADFASLYIVLCLSSSALTLSRSYHVGYGYGRSLGGVGVAVGLRIFTLLLQYKSMLGLVSSSEFQQALVSQFVMDGFIYGNYFPIGAYVGGGLGAWIWYRFMYS